MSLKIKAFRQGRQKYLLPSFNDFPACTGITSSGKMPVQPTRREAGMATQALRSLAENRARNPVSCLGLLLVCTALWMLPSTHSSKNTERTISKIILIFFISISNKIYCRERESAPSRNIRVRIRSQ